MQDENDSLKDDDQLTKLFYYLDQRFDEVNRRFDAVDIHFDKIEQRLDHVEQRLDGVEERLSGVENTVDALYAMRSTEETERLAMQQKLDRHERWHHQTADKLGLKLDYEG